MNNGKSVLAQSTEGTLFFWCPGCQELHGVWLKPVPNPITKAIWTWNGDWVRPTFSPSILVNRSKAAKQPRCHSFVTDGVIRYCSDSDHSLAGKAVPLPVDPFGQSAA